MNIALDFEFYEDGKTIVPISLGMVNADDFNQQRYWEFIFDWHQVPSDHWLHANVKPLLTGISTPTFNIKSEILNFCGQSPKFWGWCAGYDFVALMQMWGSFDEQDEPRIWNWPFHINDLAGRVSRIPRGNTEMVHNALADALDIARAVRRYHTVAS